MQRKEVSCVTVTVQYPFALSQIDYIDYGLRRVFFLYKCLSLGILLCHRAINLQWQSTINSARNAVYFS